MDKKNTLLLTVIAIATLLVAVVGATFAYFSAQIGESQSTNMTVTTSSEDTLTYGSFKPLYIVANQTNFAQVGQEESENKGSQKGVATGRVEYRKGGGETSKNYCYTAKLTVSANTFKYPTFAGFDFKSDPDAPSMDSEHAPELLLTLTKVHKTKDDPTGEESGTIVYKGSLPNAGASITYEEGLSKTRRVCLQEGTNGVITSCEDGVTLKGYDITEFTQTIDIPTTDGGSTLKHELSASAENETVTDEWTAELVFVNYDWDQQYNVGKVFTGTLDFANVECGD